MSVKPDQSMPYNLIVGRDAGASPSASAHDPVAELARSLLDGGAATCVTDRRGELVYANAAYERIAVAVAEAGLAPIGRPIDARVDDTASESTRRQAIEVDGEIVPYQIREQILRDAAGGMAGRAAVYTPVAEPDNAKTKLAAAVERLDDITRLVSDWVWETDRDLVLTYLSPRVHEVLGYHQLQLAGRHLVSLLAEPSAAIEALSTKTKRRPFRDQAVKIADSGGEIHHVLLSGLPIYCPSNGDFLGFRGTAQDISELQRREQALLRAKEAAEFANRTKSEFLASMSHELRTPLNAIIGFSEIMDQEMLGPIGNARYKGYATDISDSARHLLELINDILDAAKIEAGEMSLAEETVDPRDLVESVRRLIAPRAERAKLRLEVRVAANVPALHVDKTKLKQILINLLSNAVKFTPEGGRVSLGVELADNGEFLFLVADSGIGIAPGDMARAMAPFGQVDSRLSRKYEGTGLGLPLAKTLTELHGGGFELVSQPELGTTVTVRLPASRVVAE
jgi:PAS domain S-box-containing protein